MRLRGGAYGPYKWIRGTEYSKNGYSNPDKFHRQSNLHG